MSCRNFYSNNLKESVRASQSFNIEWDTFRKRLENLRVIQLYKNYNEANIKGDYKHIDRIREMLQGEKMLELFIAIKQSIKGSSYNPFI